MANNSLNIIIMGPPAAGKGTQSEKIVDKYHIPHISTGDMLRNAIENKTQIGLEAKKYMNDGLLVPDDVIIKIVQERLLNNDCKNGFLLDGFPRTVTQAIALDKMLLQINKKLNSCILLTADYGILISRITSRRVCPTCGASYNLISKKPKVEGICDLCSSSLIQREDDTSDAFKVRLNAYDKQTLPIADYYRKNGLLYEINALDSIDDVFKSIEKILQEVSE